jgi:DNA-binding LacI/PurR family transcriptional regulator
MVKFSSTSPILPLNLQRHLPKHAKLKLALQETLKHLKPGQALSSISTLQKEFGVAQGTVTRVLRDLQAEGLVEARHGSGIFATGRAQLKSIAIHILFDILNPKAGQFPGLLLKGLEQAAGRFQDVQFRHYFQAGTGVLWPTRVCTLEADVRQRLVDGIIALGVYDGRLDDLPVPVVALYEPAGVTCRINLDFESLIGHALTLLNARGCKRVALLGQDKEPDPQASALEIRLKKQRLEFFLQETARQGLTTRPEWICSPENRGLEQLVPAAGEAFTEVWGSVAEKPDSLICLDDYMAVGAVQAIRKLGLEPDRDIRIVTHANRGSTVLEGLPVTAIEFDPADVAFALLETTNNLIEGVRVASPVLVPPMAGRFVH